MPFVSRCTLVAEVYLFLLLLRNCGRRSGDSLLLLDWAFDDGQHLILFQDEVVLAVKPDLLAGIELSLASKLPCGNGQSSRRRNGRSWGGPPRSNPGQFSELRRGQIQGAGCDFSWLCNSEVDLEVGRDSQWVRVPSGRRGRGAAAIALHMHQPLIPAGGSDLRTAAIISNLQNMMENRRLATTTTRRCFSGATGGWES